MKLPAGLDLIMRLPRHAMSLSRTSGPASRSVSASIMKHCTRNFRASVYCSVSYMDRKDDVGPARIDPVFQAEMGLMSFWARLTVGPSGTRSPLSISSLASMHRRRSGGDCGSKDNRPDVISMYLDGGPISVPGNAAQYYFTCEEPPPRVGNGSDSGPRRRLAATEVSSPRLRTQNSMRTN